MALKQARARKENIARSKATSVTAMTAGQISRVELRNTVTGYLFRVELRYTVP